MQQENYKKLLSEYYAFTSEVCDFERQDVIKPITEIRPDNSKNCSMCSRD